MSAADQRSRRKSRTSFSTDTAAKRRLADEYDAAQERGEVVGKLRSAEELSKPTAADVGLSRKDIHEARIIRDAEKGGILVTPSAAPQTAVYTRPPIRGTLHGENRSILTRPP